MTIFIIDSFLDYSFYEWYKEIPPLEFHRAQGDILKCLVLSNQQFKTQKYSINSDIK